MNEKEMIILCDGSTRYAEVDVTELKDGRFTAARGWSD